MEEKINLVIIDSHALLHRSFHALPPLINKKNEPTNAVYGFLLTLFKTIQDLKPDYIVACFDRPEPTFRHEQFKDYKAQRPKTPDELSSQIPKAKEVSESLNIPVFEKQGFEADDLIATIVKKTKQEKNLQVYILTADLDTLQLVDEKTKVCALGRGIKESIIYDREKIFSRFGLFPRQMTDFKALKGDPSDNISGVPGIGEKTGAELLKRFDNLKNLYQKIEAGEADIKPRTKDVLLKGKKEAFLSQSLVKLNNSAPIDFNLEKCRLGQVDKSKAEKTLKELGFNSLISRLSILAN